ncbi:MarR family winged helix-turn-helix transcriptional regulator [Pseudooceanicola nanhaiensis]|uniref:MarR family winged helix-turn-helix transcriptional regulator n=1 Tax=Pseudooceanicola nanhaiensis TaxID=375761 RepID=UPI003514A3DF
MSHKATNWLAALDAEDLTNSEFRVLFHLCDCHNPSQGCFPTQAYLIDATGVSNGTLNNALRGLEAKGLLRRERHWDGKTHKQLPTHYVLGCDAVQEKKPAPKTGDGGPKKPTPKNGDGADSKFDGVPSPNSTTSRLQPTGEVTCKEPVNNLPSSRAAACFDEKVRVAARYWAGEIRGGRFIPANAISSTVAACMILEGLITREEAEAVGIGDAA